MTTTPARSRLPVLIAGGLLLACGGFSAAGLLLGGRPQPEPAPRRAAVPSAAAETAVLREITVALAADEEFRARPGWAEEAAARVRRASVPYEREFGIRWKPVEFVEWHSDDAAPSLRDLRRALERDVDPGPADVVLGFAGQDRRAGATHQYAELGVSEYFGRAAIVGAGWSRQSPGREDNAVAHELGHLLGAWHCPAQGTIMTAGSADLSRFDAQSALLLPAMRDFDFRRGLDGIGDETAAAIDRIWRAGHGPGADHPLAYALMVRGWQRARAGSPVSAKLDLDRAVSILETSAGSEDPGLVACLVGLSRLCAERDPPDAAGALGFAQRARRIADATRLNEDPSADSWVQLGNAWWVNGRETEAAAAFQQALEVRARVLGSDDPLTAAVRRDVQWFAARAAPAATRASDDGTRPSAASGPSGY